jgi:hypothetical protein
MAHSAENLKENIEYPPAKLYFIDTIYLFLQLNLNV